MKSDPNAPVVLMSVGTDAEAGMVASTLRERGVEARVIDAVGSTLAIFGPALNQPTQIVVRRADAERAAAILRDVRQESVDINWSEIDVGDGPDSHPPRADRRKSDRHLAATLLIIIVLVILVFVGFTI